MYPYIILYYIILYYRRREDPHSERIADIPRLQSIEKKVRAKTKLV
jgi:hypothetical protein